jgi:hypothetical protein
MEPGFPDRLLWSLGNRPKVIEGKNACGMTVRPAGLDTIGSNESPTLEDKCGCGQGFVWVFVEIAHYIRLAFASRARTMPAELLKFDIGLGTVLPLDCEFVAYALDIL